MAPIGGYGDDMPRKNKEPFSCLKKDLEDVVQIILLFLQSS